MKNGDMPAMPFEAVTARMNGNATGWTNYTGLTKRETMAMHIMAGMFAAECVGPLMTDVATMAVTQADLLLAELERTES